MNKSSFFSEHTPDCVRSFIPCDFLHSHIIILQWLMLSFDAVPPQSPWNHPWFTLLRSNWHVVFGMCHCRAIFGLAIISRSFRIRSGWYGWFCCYCGYYLNKSNKPAARVTNFMNLMGNSLDYPFLFNGVTFAFNIIWCLFRIKQAHPPSSNTSLVFLQQKISVGVGNLWPSRCCWITISDNLQQWTG